jgi:L-seryl-tRNA(Ser) seleniumtransferase
VARPGGLVLRALQDVALAYLDRRAHELPFWRMATAPVDGLRARAEAIVPPLPGARALACASVVGGGALPGVEIPSWGVALPGDHRAALRAAAPTPIVARARHGETVLDLRTVAPAEDAAVAAALATCVVG